MKTTPGTTHKHRGWFGTTTDDAPTHTHDVDLAKYDKAIADIAALTTRVAELEKVAFPVKTNFKTQ